MSKVNFSWVKNFNFLLETVIPFDWEQLNVGKKVSDFNKNLKFANNNKEIVKAQAKIIDCKLRQAFSKLFISDFSDPSGFAEIEKASFRVKNFLEVRNTLESYIKNNVEVHQKNDLQCMAFQRWIETADYLRKAQCYEGAFLIINALLQLDIKLKLTSHLPQSYQRKFANQIAMISPSNNFIKLRKEITQAKSATKFVPVFLRAKDITTLNYLLDQNMDNESKQANFKKKMAILVDIKREQKEKSPGLPDELEKIYQRAQAKYGSECNMAKKVGNNKINNSSNRPDVSAGKETMQYQVIKIKIKKSTRIYFYNELPAFWQKECRETVREEHIIAPQSTGLAR
ncbi:RasGEF domain-containing protein [Legionella clemsonensis]|uniref:RasGEF domain protein n=1 Tax=Legionella clemsonensis TaxID=1867846 RepID=A0A222P2L1_9GAMM|nr:RasGEF domain-containing protein [Legionella clemsonensis]ASQ46067.1 RasGEF domain protein [Legionella clemsonensis]